MIRKHATTLLFVLTLQSAAQTQPIQENYQLDVKKSKILWNTGKMMGGHYGYLLFTSGILQYSANGTPVSGVFIMDMNSMRSTDNPEEVNRLKTNANLRKVEFFAADQYPSSVINVKKITRIGSSINYKIFGELTIKGITNAIDFIAVIDPKKDTVHITANVDISHQLWNINSKPQNKSSSFLSVVPERIVGDIHVSLDLTLTK